MTLPRFNPSHVRLSHGSSRANKTHLKTLLLRPHLSIFTVQTAVKRVRESGEIKVKATPGNHCWKNVTFPAYGQHCIKIFHTSVINMATEAQGHLEELLSLNTTHPCIQNIPGRNHKPVKHSPWSANISDQKHVSMFLNTVAACFWK